MSLESGIKKMVCNFKLGICSGTNNVIYYKYLKGNKEMSSSKHGFVKKKVCQVFLIYFFKMVISPLWTWEKQLVDTASTSTVVL